MTHESSGIPGPLNAQQPSCKSARISILYVDDDPDLLEICKLVLEKSGDFQVDTEISPVAAISRIQSSAYDVIVSDYQMPEMNGIEFLAGVERIRGKLPFILFTGKSREEILFPALNDMTGCYLQKSVDGRSLNSTLGNAIKKVVVYSQRHRNPDESGLPDDHSKNQ